MPVRGLSLYDHPAVVIVAMSSPAASAALGITLYHTCVLKRSKARKSPQEPFARHVPSAFAHI
jgi:hypothetical protein